MPASGGDATQMTTDQGADYDVAWSPDGSQIVFTSNRAGSPDIWRMPVGGGVATALTSGPGQGWIFKIDHRKRVLAVKCRVGQSR